VFFVFAGTPDLFLLRDDRVHGPRGCERRKYWSWSCKYTLSVFDDPTTTSLSHWFFHYCHREFTIIIIIAEGAASILVPFDPIYSPFVAYIRLLQGERLQGTGNLRIFPENREISCIYGMNNKSRMINNIMYEGKNN